MANHNIKRDDKAHRLQFKREIRRKSLHFLMGGLYPLYLALPTFTTWISICGIVGYFFVELLRSKGKRVPFFTTCIEWGMRKRNSKKWDMGPLFLVVGIILNLNLFPKEIAWVGIVGVIFGDGMASIGGMYWQGMYWPHSRKRISGSLTCFFTTFIVIMTVYTIHWYEPLSLQFAWLTEWKLLPSALSFIDMFLVGGAVALTVTLLEAIPLKDFDNIIIPIGGSFFYIGIVALAV